MNESEAANWLYLNGYLGYSLKLQALTELLETNTAEAKAEQREACAAKCKALSGRQYDDCYQADEIAKLENIITRAVGWWLLEGQKESIGAPAWVFDARRLIDGEDE